MAFSMVVPPGAFPFTKTDRGSYLFGVVRKMAQPLDAVGNCQSISP
jgi:hypothetical protein